MKMEDVTNEEPMFPNFDQPKIYRKHPNNELNVG